MRAAVTPMRRYVEWHDSAEEPPRGPLWAYLKHGLIEMATHGQDGWRSAFNPSVIYDEGAVLAWAVVEYPYAPVRRWESQENASDENSDTDSRALRPNASPESTLGSPR